MRVDGFSERLLKIFQCQFCDETFAAKTTVRRHVFNVH